MNADVAKDLAIATNAGFVVLVRALLQSNALSHDDILDAIARTRQSLAKTDQGGPITEAIFRCIEAAANPDHTQRTEPPLWTPVLVKRDEDGE